MEDSTIEKSRFQTVFVLLLVLVVSALFLAVT